MKVLMFGWEFPPHISGGLGTACYGLVKALSGFSDMELTFVVPKIWGDEDKLEVNFLGANEIPVIRSQIQFEDMKAKVEYYELQSELIPYLGTNEFYELKSKFSSGAGRLVETTTEGKVLFDGDYGQNLFQEIQSYALVAEILASELDFDVIHVHDWMTFPAGMAVRRISGKPLVVHVHSTEFDRSGYNINSAVYAIEKEGMEAADVIIAVSNFTREIIIGKYYIEPNKVKTVFNAVEPLINVKIKNSSRTGDEKVVSFLGRITFQKGPSYFVEAANLVLQKMKDVCFVMAGKGDLRNSMIQRVAELNISDHFEFPGFLQDSEVPELFQRSDVFLMPSVSEPFGIVALEAMQSGICVMISKQSGVSEVLKHAIQLDYWDVQAMANAICELLSNKKLANKYKREGKKEVEQLKWKYPADEIHRIYLQLCHPESSESGNK